MAGKKEKAPAKATGKASAKASASSAGGSSKAKKKKWSKGKTKEKANNLVVYDDASYEKMLSEIPNQKLITPSTLCDRLKVNGSLARRTLRELQAKGLVVAVSTHNSQWIFTRATPNKGAE